MLPWRRRTGTRSLDSHFRDLELDSAMYEGLTSNECRAVVMYDIATQSNISAVGERYRKRPGLSNLPRAFVRARTVPAAFCSLVLYGSYLVDDRTYTTGAITAADVSAACPQCTDPKALSWFKTWDSKACNKLIMDHQHFAPGESTPISDTWSSPDTSPSSAGETRPSPTDSSYEKAQADDEAVWAVVKRHARLIGKAAFPRYKVFQAEDIANGNNGFGHSVRYHQKDEYAPALYIWYEFKGRICTSSRIVKGSTRGKPFAEIDTVKRILLATLTVAKASKKPVVRAILRKIDKETDGVRLACHFLSIAALLE